MQINVVRDQRMQDETMRAIELLRQPEATLDLFEYSYGTNKKRKRKEYNANYYSQNRKGAKALDEHLQQRNVTESTPNTSSSDAVGV